MTHEGTPATPGSPRAGAGYGAAVSAYAIWGLFPAFWQALDPAGSIEVLAHRIAWTFLLMVGVLTCVRGWHELRGLSARTWGLVTAAALLVAANWGVYIWATTHGRVVESALGYYVHPLIAVLLGVVLLSERLRRLQWIAIAVATVAVGVLTVAAGSAPWVAFVLASAFAFYGLLKKMIPLGPLAGLTAEGFVLGPIAIGFLLTLEGSGAGSFTGHGIGHTLLLVATGPATALPLVLFAAAARRLTLTTLGMLQYLNPSLQFAWGVGVDGEAMTPARWTGFVLVWLALVVFTVDALRHHSRARGPLRRERRRRVPSRGRSRVSR